MMSVRRGWASVILAGTITGCGGGDNGGTGPDPNAVSSVVVAPPTASLNAVGATTTFSAEARNSSGAVVSGKSFTWTTDAGGVATVNPSGVVTAVGNGTATIRATVVGGTQSGTASVTVQQAVQAVAVTPATGTVVVGRTLLLTGSATDPGGAAVSPPPALTWSSSNTAVATVSTAGLVSGIAPGSANVTAASGAVSASAAITVQLPSIALGQDTTLAGTLALNSVTIPAGRTVTVTGPLTMNAAGRINIAGTITGSCVPVSILGDTAITITGTVANGCNTGTNAALNIRSNGELDLDGATITSSGDITLGNSPDHTEGSFPFVQRKASRAVALPLGGVRYTRINNSTIRFFGNQGAGAGPDPAASGVDGVTGTPGADGRAVKLFVDGNATFAGSTTVWGQEGGRGGNGVAPASSTNLTTTGGAGGRGGLIRIYTTGNLIYQGMGNVVRAGRGGNGGSATATTTTNAALGAKGPSATANGGAGGEPGLIDIKSSNGIIIQPNALLLELIPGLGGNATATGARGADATALQAAQEGGDATANAGKGGNTPDARLTSAGVNGAPTFNANGARGGDASASAGNGGDGLKPNKDGGKGGRPTSVAGGGGDARLRDQNNALIGNGGDAGSASFKFGNGGLGWADCVPGQEEPGGHGGDGASLSAINRGRGGTGILPGADGKHTYENLGNGGNGGRGAGPGRGGRGGTGHALGAGDTGIPPLFNPGTPGVDCTPPPPPADEDVDIRIDLPVQSGAVPAGNYLWSLLDQVAAVVGSIPVAGVGPANSLFTAQNPSRIGWSSAGSWVFDVANAIVGGSPFEVSIFSICIINASVDQANPVFIRELDANGLVVATTEVTVAAAPIVAGALASGPGCPDITLTTNTKKVRVEGTGKGPFGDGYKGKMKGKRKK